MSFQLEPGAGIMRRPEAGANAVIRGRPL